MSRKVSVYSSQKMTFLDGYTQLCTQLAENWKMVVFGQFCLLTCHKKWDKVGQNKKKKKNGGSTYEKLL